MTRLHILALTALVCAYALGPMATQILTPAVPFVHRDFGIPMAAAQTLVSLAFATIAVMTLVYGPLSDRYGRRPVILIGTSLFCVGSLIAAVAIRPEWMMFGRVVQAAGSAAGLTLTRTIIHDVYGRERSSQALAYLTTVMIFVPMLSPTLGGILLDHVGWRALFAVCMLFGMIALALLVIYMPETHHSRKREIGFCATFAVFGQLMCDRNFLGPALFFACVMASFFVTQAGIPYLVVEVLGGTATEYGVWFGVACIFYVLGNYLTGRWGNRFQRRTLILFSGVGCLATAVAGFIAAHAFAWSTALLFLPTIMLYFLGAIAVAPAQAEAVAAQPAHSGAASGLLSGLQMAIGAAVVQMVGFAHDGTPQPMAIGIIACTGVALAAVASVYSFSRTAFAGAASR